MMKKRYWPWALGLLSFAGTVWGATKTIQTIQNIKIIEGVQITEPFLFAGDIRIVHSQLGIATLSGKASMSHDQFLGDVNIAGSVEMKHVEFEKTLSVSGAIRAQQSHFAGNVDFKGDLDDDTSVYDGSLTLVGQGRFSKTVLKKDTEFHSDQIEFSGSETRSLIFKKKRFDSKSHYLYINKNTTVHGDIVFENERGKVFLENGSQILGKVVGGTVENQSSNALNRGTM
jgi:predicted acyltransferase (DUF342 family)